MTAPSRSKPPRAPSVTRPPLPRRTFLRGLAGGALALPALEAMSGRGRFAEAASSTSPDGLPLRLLIFFPCNGSTYAHWQPKVQGRDYELPSALRGLADVKSDVVVASGLHQRIVRSKGSIEHIHGELCALTGRPWNPDVIYSATGPSFDQLYAAKVGHETVHPSLIVNVNANRRSSWVSAGQPSPFLQGPQRIFDTLFGATAKAAVAAGGRRRAILDYVRQDARRLHTSLGAADRVRLDQHLSAVEEVDRQLRLAATNANACSDVAAPMVPAALSRAKEVELVSELVRLAFSCDLTRVAVINVGPIDDVPRSATDKTPVGDHDASHMDDEIIGRTSAIKMDMFGEIVRRFKATAEGGSTLLRQSLLMTAWDISHGNWHNFDDMPMVLAGQAGGRLRSGFHIRYSDQPTSQLFITALNALGVEIDEFGLEGVGGVTGLWA